MLVIYGSEYGWGEAFARCGSDEEKMTTLKKAIAESSFPCSKTAGGDAL
jgi:hypothetical protein